MDKNLILGTIIMALALGLIIYLIGWCRKTIEHIRKKKLSSAREIIKSFHEQR